MKVKILHLIPALFLAGGMLLSNVAKAQHEGLSPNESQDPEHLEYTANEEKPAVADHDGKSKLLNRDSLGAHNRPSSPTASKAKSPDHNKSVGSKEEDEDALSFNFLYYIIQKFKISDLVDE
jgi:hypothetical protein